MGIGYNFGNALLGATAPAIATALIPVTGNEIVPAYYLIAASVLIIPVIYYLRETAHAQLAER
jgi:MHS family proline/betaine transporter-like MFS transporter